MSWTKFKFPLIRKVQTPLFHLGPNPTIQPMTLPAGSIFSINYTYQKRYTPTEWKQMYFDGKRSCFDWEAASEGFEIKTPDGLVIAWVRPLFAIVNTEVIGTEDHECTFYPYGSNQRGTLEGLKEWARQETLDYGFKILDEKFRVMT